MKSELSAAYLPIISCCRDCLCRAAFFLLCLTYRRGSEGTKVAVEHVSVTRNEVMLRCPELDRKMPHTLSPLRSGLQRLYVWDDEREVTSLTPDGMVYCKSVNERTSVYVASTVYQTALNLVEVEGRHGETSRYHIRKSAVTNLHHIHSLKSIPARKTEAVLEIGEKLLVSRHHALLLGERPGL